MIFKKAIYFSLLLSLAGCTSVKNSYDLLSFRQDPNSGITNQQLGLNFIYEKNRYSDSNIDIFKKIGETIPGIQTYQQDCTNIPPSSRRESFAGAFAGATITAAIGFVANEAYDYVKNSISTYAEDLAKKSVAEKIIKVPFHGFEGRGKKKKRKVEDWQKVNCVALTRYNAKTNEIGMFILLEKQTLTESYIFTPRLVYLKNSPAITEIGTKEKPAQIKIDVGFALHAILYDKKTSRYNNIEISSLSIPLGKMKFGETKTVTCKTKHAGPYCKEASGLIPDIPKNAKTIEVAFKVVETGSATNAKTLAESTNKALDGIVKPGLDQLVGQISSKLGQ
ncbi:hypothetical protein [Roseibium sp.]|uniref:hypothetical protein n=1 Tax=Roseibium sp. TaxID=1936156 RepID=UPI003BB01E44